MIDLHSHYLYGIDDGSKSEKMTLDMLRQAESLGFQYLLATPHVNFLSNQKYSDKIVKRFKEINILIEKENIKLKTGLGAEIAYDAEYEKLLNFPFSFFGNGHKYMLFELPVYYKVSQISDFIFKQMLNGITPILAHPERIKTVQDDPQTLVQWYHQGSLMQINAGSISGQFGNSAREFAFAMIENGLACLVASDAHEAASRSYQVMADARDIISEKYSETVAADLFVHNPERAVYGKKIKPGPIDEQQFLKKSKGGIKRFLRLLK